MTPLVGSGPYRVGQVDAGKSITLHAQSRLLGARSGGQSRLLEFRRGALRLLPRRQRVSRGVQEGPVRHAQGGRSRPLADRLRLPGACATAASSRRPSPRACRSRASNFVFNTRRAIFADIRVREAIALLFDFEWVNRSIFFGLYRRSASFFEGSELSARGRPADERERALLAPFPDAVRADVLDGTWQPPVTRRLGARPHAAAPRARAARRGRLRAARHRAGRTRERQARSASRSSRVNRRRGASGAAVTQRNSSAPESRRRCALSTRYNTRRGESPSIST